MTVLIKILQVILALSVLIIIHEAGHFSFAKLFGIRVDKFFLFFDAGGFKLLSTKEGWFSRLLPKGREWETEYGIGWLPLGGYCKICGMIDESMDLESMKKDPEPWEFRVKPAWQRLLVMAGGVLYNFLFAILVYIGIMAIWGSSYVSNEGNAVYPDALAREMGFLPGDRILRMDDYVPENFGMLQADLARVMAQLPPPEPDAEALAWARELTLRGLSDAPNRDPEAPLCYDHAIRLPGNHSKFMIRQDPADGTYLTIISRILGPAHTSDRNLLSLMKSADCEHWTLVCDLIDRRGDDPRQVGFQYVDFFLEGDDLLWLCRTAMNGAHNFHDANYSTFHRLRDFRTLAAKAGT